MLEVREKGTKRETEGQRDRETETEIQGERVTEKTGNIETE